MSDSLRRVVMVALVGCFLRSGDRIAIAQLGVDGLMETSDLSDETSTLPGVDALPIERTPWGEVPVERFRRQFFQGVEVGGGVLWGLGDQLGGLNQSHQEVRIGGAIPLGSLDHVLAVQPYFRVDQLDGPTAVALPETLYDTGLTLFNREQWTPRLSSTLIVTPSVRSDFTTSENAFRLFGLGLLTWQANPEWSFSIGAVYLDRSDLSVLPAVGLTWTPEPWWRIDLTMPRPRIARRLWKRGGEAEGWAYLGGTLGGNTWAITQEDGQPDELTLGHLRLMVGYETIVAGNRGTLIEVGYVFHRSIELERPERELELDDAISFQAGWKF